MKIVARCDEAEGWNVEPLTVTLSVVIPGDNFNEVRLEIQNFLPPVVPPIIAPP